MQSHCKPLIHCFAAINYRIHYTLSVRRTPFNRNPSSSEKQFEWHSRCRLLLKMHCDALTFHCGKTACRTRHPIQFEQEWSGSRWIVSNRCLPPIHLHTVCPDRAALLVKCIHSHGSLNGFCIHSNSIISRHEKTEVWSEKKNTQTFHLDEFCFLFFRSFFKSKWIIIVSINVCNDESHYSNWKDINFVRFECQSIEMHTKQRHDGLRLWTRRKRTRRK